MASVSTTRENHVQECLLGWQEVEPLWTVRKCPHGRIQRREPGEYLGSTAWRDLSPIEHPILWMRAKRTLERDRD